MESPITRLMRTMDIRMANMRKTSFVIQVGWPWWLRSSKSNSPRSIMTTFKKLSPKLLKISELGSSIWKVSAKANKFTE